MNKYDKEIKTVFDMLNGAFDGGKGSGNFGHSGRPGKVGGSSSAGSMKGIVTNTVKNEGATVHAQTGYQPKDGYMIGAGAESKWVDFKEDSPENRSKLAKALNEFLEKNKELLSSPDNYLGTWWDKKNGQISLDVSIRETDKAKAIKMGQDRNERAIYDLGSGESIDTGGTGNNLEG